LDFKPFVMAFSPQEISIHHVSDELKHAWESSYSPAANASVIKWLERKSFPDRLIHLLARLAFRGIYFPQMKWRAWVRLVLENRSPILRLVFEALQMRFSSRRPALNTASCRPRHVATSS
jgi:hypothetical protein